MHANFISRMREDTSQSRASRGFTKLWRLLQRKRHINIELCVRLGVSGLFQVGHAVQNRRSVLSLVWREWFSYKRKE